MKKRLLLTVFVAVLLLAGLTAVFAVEIPGGGGAVSDGEYQVWLPVVGNTPPWWVRYIFHTPCPYPELVNPHVLEVGANGEYIVAAGNTPVEFQVASECDPYISYDQNMGLSAFASMYDITNHSWPAVWRSGTQYPDESNRYFVRGNLPVVLESGRIYELDMSYIEGNNMAPGDLVSGFTVVLVVH